MKNQKNKVETIVIASTVLKQADYDKTTGLLSLTFNNNKKYNYVNVPEEIWKNFKLSPSKGKFYTKFIKDNYKDPNFKKEMLTNKNIMI